MDKKTTLEIMLAAAIGAFFGTFLAIMLITVFAVSWHTCLPISCLVGIVVAGISYRPGEAGSTLLSVLKRFGHGIASVKGTLIVKGPIRAITNGFVAAGKAISKRRRGFGIAGYVILLLSVFVIASRFSALILESIFGKSQDVSPWFIAPVLAFFTLFALVGLLVHICEPSTFGNPSWYMPITARVARTIRPIVESDKEVRFSDYLLLIAVAIAWPFLALVIAPLTILCLIVDIATTIALSLASSARVSAIIGGLIGTLIGCNFFASHSFPVTSIIIGMTSGALIGGLAYALRHALTYRRKPAQADCSA